MFFFFLTFGEPSKTNLADIYSKEGGGVGGLHQVANIAPWGLTFKFWCENTVCEKKWKQITPDPISFASKFNKILFFTFFDEHFLYIQKPLALEALS